MDAGRTAWYYQHVLQRDLSAGVFTTAEQIDREAWKRSDRLTVKCGEVFVECLFVGSGGSVRAAPLLEIP